MCGNFLNSNFSLKQLRKQKEYDIVKTEKGKELRKVKKQAEEQKKEIQKKLEQLKLNFGNDIPSIFQLDRKIRYKALKGYDNTNYKVYHFVDIRDIEIYLTQGSRLEEADKKYKSAMPLICYLQPDKEEFLEQHMEFLRMVKEADLDKIKEVEKEQKKFQKQIPFEVRYQDNFIWEIYYSEVDHKYFMMFSTQEKQTEAFFYLIKKQIELQKSKKKEMIYVPINNLDYTSGLLKKSEIADLENYLWYFTKSWPFIYEIKEKDNTTNIQIVGKVPIYQKVKSIYKIKLDTKEEAQKQFKLIKALFILESNTEEEYPFQTGIGEDGGLNFCYNHNKITYEGLAEFIKNEIEKKKQKKEEIDKQSLLETEKWLLLRQVVQKQNLEYMAKEKQIVTFLECKKTFFGKISYFFKSKKKKGMPENQKQEKLETEKIENKEIELEEKEFYTIEDLIKVCQVVEAKQKQLKNRQMDIKALENKKENLERKIKNATLYINEIESHKKSIFDFWKFTNKDEVPLLLEGEQEEEKEKKHRIQKVFSYEEEIEEVGKKIDRKQRTIFSKKECDAIFAIKQDKDAFNIVRKAKRLKKDETYLAKSLKEKQEQYKEEFETMQEKDFDIFGSVVEDKTKIKVLNNQKHREIAKDKFKTLDIHMETTKEEYEDNIKHYEILLEEAYGKMTCPYDMSAYQVSQKPVEHNNWEIFNLNAKQVIETWKGKEDKIILNRINIKENMPIIFYSNIMFYENLNQTLPEGMDVETEVLIDLTKYEMKLVGRKDISKNFLEDEFTAKVKTIEVYEYDIQRKEQS